MDILLFGLQTALFGLLTVFAVLFSIVVLTVIMSKIVKVIDQKSPKKQ